MVERRQDTVKPDPDPTVLTTQQLLREITNLEKGLDTRIDGIEKSITVAHDNLVRVPTSVDKAVETLRTEVGLRFDTEDVRFEGIATQFKERDTRVEQTAKASKDALDAALQAQKEAVSEQNKSNGLAIAKSEAATNKQIDGLIANNSATASALNDKIEDLKERLTRIEGTGTGRSDMVAWIVAGFSLLSTISMLVFYVSKITK